MNGDRSSSPPFIIQGGSFRPQQRCAEKEKFYQPWIMKNPVYERLNSLASEMAENNFLFICVLLASRI